jgi:type IV pili sensor histidine kinase/response regulator
MKTMKKSVLIILILVLEIFQLGYANTDINNTNVGRYLTVSNKPKSSQLDLLSQVIQIRFPQSVQTIGDAMNYALRLSGYGLIPSDRMSEELKTTLGKPLPAIDRNFGPMSLKNALSTLAGPAFNLVQDPLNRMVDFRVKPQFARLYALDTNPTNTMKKN